MVLAVQGDPALCTLAQARNEWRDWAKIDVRTANMPSNTGKIDKYDARQGYVHWFGTGSVCGDNGQQFLTFAKALLHARPLKLESKTVWARWYQRGACPFNVPANQQRTYTQGVWQGYGHSMIDLKVAVHRQQPFWQRACPAVLRGFELRGVCMVHATLSTWIVCNPAHGLPKRVRALHVDMKIFLQQGEFQH